MKINKEELINKTFGCYTVLSYNHTNKNKLQYYNCICKCGNKKLISKIDLLYATPKNCSLCQHGTNINDYILNDMQRQILTGLMLGDGHLSKTENNKNAMLEVSRQLKDQEYQLYHAKILKDIMTINGIKYKNYIDSRTNKLCSGIKLRTRAAPCLTELHNIWYQNKIKIIPENLKLTNIIIATWLADDAHFRYFKRKDKIFYNEPRIEIATNGFTKKETQFLADLLIDRYNCHIALYSSKKCKEQYIISIIRQNDVYKIFKDIATVFPPGLERKEKFLMARREII